MTRKQPKEADSEAAIERRVIAPGVGTYLDESQYVDALRANVKLTRLGEPRVEGTET